jgi:hypothetical protein
LKIIYFVQCMPNCLLPGLWKGFFNNCKLRTAKTPFAEFYFFTEKRSILRGGCGSEGVGSTAQPAHLQTWDPKLKCWWLQMFQYGAFDLNCRLMEAINFTYVSYWLGTSNTTSIHINFFKVYLLIDSSKGLKPKL